MAMPSAAATMVPFLEGAMPTRIASAPRRGQGKVLRGVEAKVGLEPTSTALQTVASTPLPLRPYSARILSDNVLNRTLRNRSGQPNQKLARTSATSRRPYPCCLALQPVGSLTTRARRVLASSSMHNRRNVRFGLKVIHRHRVGSHEFRRVSELVFIRGRPKAI